MLRIGYHAEGHDHLILHRIVCRLLGLDPSEICARPIERRFGRRADIQGPAKEALRRFYYGDWAIAAMLGIDNDGGLDLRRTGRRQDPRHPRHWIHAEAGREVDADCRFCQLRLAADGICAHFDAAGFIAGAEWGLAVCVPTEAIESWLLVAKGLVEGDNSLLDAESRPAGEALKRELCGGPMATERNVRDHAIPYLEQLDELTRIGEYSRSFALFAEQIAALRPAMQLAATKLGHALWGSP